MVCPINGKLPNRKTWANHKDGSRYWGVFAHRENSFGQLRDWLSTAKQGR